MQKYKLFSTFALTAQLIVPFLPKTANQRHFEIAVKRHTFAPTLPYGAAADVPLVVVDCLKLAKILDADRVEVA